MEVLREGWITGGDFKDMLVIRAAKTKQINKKAIFNSSKNKKLYVKDK